MSVIRPASVLVVVLVLVLLGGAALPASAAAHGMSDTADVSLAQTFAGNELTVILRRTPAVPGPLRLDVIAHRPVHAVDLQLRLGGERRVLMLRGPGVHSTTLQVTAPGPHELVLQAGEHRALLPFRVLTPRTAHWSGSSTAVSLARGSPWAVHSWPRRPIAAALPSRRPERSWSR